MPEDFFAVYTLSDLSAHSNHLGGNVAEMMEAILVFFEQLMSLESDQVIPTLIPGIDAMPNWHPFFVHFPIALLPIFFLLDIFGTFKKSVELRQVASYFLYFGTVSSVFAIIAGFKAAETVMHGNDVHSVMETHELFGLTVTLIALALALWRYHSKPPERLMANILHQSLALLLCIFLTLGADLGGLMVYKYGVGIASVQASADSHEHMRDL